MFIKTKPGFLLREIGQTYIVVPVGAEAQKFNGIIKLNKTGKFLWETVSQGIEFEDLIDAILSEYDIDDEVARKDAQSFVEKASAANLIELKQKG